ncbi:hypothetical protein [Microbacterium sp. P02]|uniref:hypothetical protein n=1 Tax=Microbacterium sp. P02 TaxID=3366260 RepID=UPI00366E39F9
MTNTRISRIVLWTALAGVVVGSLLIAVSVLLGASPVALLSVVGGLLTAAVIVWYGQHILFNTELERGQNKETQGN